MKKRVVVSPSAASDLNSIAVYTFEQWGDKRRQTYLDDLENSITALGLMPGLGRRRDELNQGWRSLPCGSHVILYTEHDDRIEVLRVIHGRQDIESAVPE